MYSQFELFAKVREIKKIYEFLNDDAIDGTWLQQCLLAISSSQDALIMGHSDKIAIMSSRWCPNDTQAKVEFHITWKGVPEGKKDNEVITAMFCLPITTLQNNKVTAHYNPEWTCFVVGYSSGYVRFYTETGCLLVTQLFHNSPVTSIKYHSSYASSCYSESNEEIYIVYDNVICTIIGIALFNTLRACRNRLARVQAKCNEMITVPPLTYRKWKFTHQQNIHDCIIGGPLPTNTFHHLRTASLCGGFNAEYRNSAPQGTLMIAVGNDPFIGFHYALESSSVPVIADVAKAMASKLKSALGQTMSGWLFGSGGSYVTTEQEAETVVEPPEPTNFRFGFYDSGRIGHSIVLSPLQNMCAISDCLGRVCIIDITTGNVIRMLKGYRDAQCGWLLVNDDKRKKNTELRKTLFLVVYVPKSGVLEVWPVHSEERVAIFDAEKYGRLLNTSNGLSNNAQYTENSFNVCVLLQPSGELKKIIVPYHCCFSDEDSEKARDTHLLKITNKYLLEKNNLTFDEVSQHVLNLATNLKTVEIKKLAVETLCGRKCITSDTYLRFLHTLEANLNTKEEDSFFTYLDKMKRLGTFFNFLDKTYQLPPDYSQVVEESSEESLVKEVCDILGMVEEDLDKLITLIPTTRTRSKHVSFSKHIESSSLNLVAFLKAFEIKTDHSLITLNTNISESLLSDISDLVCSGIMCSKCDIDLWIKKCQYSGINPTEILKLVFCYWLNKQMGITISREMLRLYRIILMICDILTDGDMKWRKIRHLLANSKSPLSAITAAIVCRAVSTYVHNAKSKSEIEFEPTEEGEKEPTWGSDWESVTEDECDWNILISELEDIAFLDSVLKYQPKSPPAKIFCVPYDVPDVTLASVIKGGKGSISELVAKWIVSMGLNPEYLLYYENTPIKKEVAIKASTGEVQEGTPISVTKCYEAKPVNTVEKEVLDSLEKLKSIFPYSLSSQNLLLNIAWEYVLAWKSSVGQLKALEAAIVTLKLIPSAHIKHGCCCLIWTVHLSQICESACRLINKVGKLPRDRLCKLHIGINEDSLTDFLRLWVNFVDIFTESITEMQATSQPVLQYECLWSNHEPVNGVSPPLCQLAAKQKMCNQRILLLQSQCSRVLLMMATFTIRMQKPISNLFDSSSEDLLFGNIQSSKQFHSYLPDEKLIECRTTFLKRVLYAVIHELLRFNVESDTQTAQCMEMLKPITEWISTVLTVASEWSVPVDTLRRYQINQLYMQGYDRLAEEIVPSISDKETLGYELLTTLGCRIKQLLKTSTNHYSEFSPNVTSWISSLEEHEKVADVDVKYLLQLALITNQLIPENSKDRYLISQVLDSLERC